MLTPADHAVLDGWPPATQARIAALWPHWRQQGYLEGRLSRDGQWRQYLRVRVPDENGRRCNRSVALGCDSQRNQRLLQALENDRAQHQPPPRDRTEPLRRALKQCVEAVARKVLRRSAPSRAAFRAAWRQIKQHGLPPSPSLAFSYAKLIALQIQPAVRGRPRQRCFTPPATALGVRPFTAVAPAELLVAAYASDHAAKSNPWNPRRPLRPEDCFMPSCVARLFDPAPSNADPPHS